MKYVENDCFYKVVNCFYCLGGFFGVKIRDYLEECSKFFVKCFYGCDKSDIFREGFLEYLKLCF